jgi:hypothetical protein
MSGLGSLRGSSRDEAGDGAGLGDGTASGAGDEAGCRPATDNEEKYVNVSQFISRNPGIPGIATTNPKVENLAQLEIKMEEALTIALIKSIENELNNAKIAQKEMEKDNKYFTGLFERYKTDLDNTKDEKIIFNDKLELLKGIFNSYPQPLATRHSISSSTRSDLQEGQFRRDGKNNPFTIKHIFTDSTYLYKRYIQSIFSDFPDIFAKIEQAFKHLDENEYITPVCFIPCIKTTKTVQEKECDFFLGITKKKIELRCILYNPRNPVYECALYINQNNTSKLFVVKITGKPRFRNVHITQVFPITPQTPSNPHITFAHTDTDPEKRLYIDCSSRTFTIHQMLNYLGIYIRDPHSTMVSRFISINNQYIKELYIKLRTNKTYKPITGGSTNKILKIKEQIKIIRGKYKTTKLDKYLIQIDKLKEKIEQLKLKDKKNKIKEQIKEVKALHKLNPKKAYVNKMIKLKEKLGNM